MKIVSKLLIGCAVIMFIACASNHAYADGVVLVGPQIQKLVPPLAALNLQHHGNKTTESGGVRWDGSRDVSFGDISAGPHQHTVSLTDLGVGRASDLRVLININEPNGGTKAPITIDSLKLIAYDMAGNEVFSADLVDGKSVTLDQFTKGKGSRSDFAFGLDDAAAARLQAAIEQNSTLRLGLSAALSNVQGGPERFAFSGAAANQPVPEPATMVLLGTGLVGVVGAVRRRRAAAMKSADESSPTDKP